MARTLIADNKNKNPRTLHGVGGFFMQRFGHLPVCVLADSDYGSSGHFYLNTSESNYLASTLRKNT